MKRARGALAGKIAVVAGATCGAGRGIAVRVDHSVPSEVADLFERVECVRVFASWDLRDEYGFTDTDYAYWGKMPG